jgi:hypothetical protein
MTDGSIPEAKFIQICQYYGQEALHFTDEVKDEIKEGMRGSCFEVRDRFEVKHTPQTEIEEKFLPHFDLKVVYCEPKEKVRVTENTKIQVDKIVDRAYHLPASSRRE